MVMRRPAFVERIVHRIEDHLEEWHRQDTARQADVEANRERLWAEAMERERLLAEAMRSEEAGRGNVEEIATQQRVAYVVHTAEMARALEAFADDKACLVRVVPGKGAHGGSGVTGSWLVFESSP